MASVDCGAIDPEPANPSAVPQRIPGDLSRAAVQITRIPKLVPNDPLGLHYSRFSPISADRLLSAQLLAGRKLENPAANRPSQVRNMAGEIRFASNQLR
jgi:hypothetical protein